VAVAIARATPLLSARTGAFAEAGAAAATTTKLMDRHIAGTPRCHGFPGLAINEARRCESAIRPITGRPGGLSIICLTQEKWSET
jgi:hypothetical protein